MAQYKKKSQRKRSGTTRRKTKKTKKSKYTELERLAHNLGKIKKGLEGDTRVKDSFNNGYNGASEKAPKKKLF